MDLTIREYKRGERTRRKKCKIKGRVVICTHRRDVFIITIILYIIPPNRLSERSKIIK